MLHLRRKTCGSSPPIATRTPGRSHPRTTSSPAVALTRTAPLGASRDTVSRSLEHKNGTRGVLHLRRKTCGSSPPTPQGLRPELPHRTPHSLRLQAVIQQQGTPGKRNAGGTSPLHLRCATPPHTHSSVTSRHHFFKHAPTINNLQIHQTPNGTRGALHLRRKTCGSSPPTPHGLRFQGLPHRTPHSLRLQAVIQQQGTPGKRNAGDTSPLHLRCATPPHTYSSVTSRHHFFRKHAPPINNLQTHQTPAPSPLRRSRCYGPSYGSSRPGSKCLYTQNSRGCHGVLAKARVQRHDGHQPGKDIPALAQFAQI